MSDTSKKKGRWIDHWNPEDEGFWEKTGKKIALRNLTFSVFAEHLGFVVWVMWTIIVINLGNAGYEMSLDEKFWMVALPALLGSLARVPYTFAVPRFGGRVWTAISAVLLLIPLTLVAFLVPSEWLLGQNHSTQFWVLLGCAATAGFGGGNFSSSMANISFFYPERKKGIALGHNAAWGNIGVPLAQVVMPLVIIIGVPAAALKLTSHEVHLSYIGFLFIPFVIAATICAWLFMDSLTEAKGDSSSYGKIMKRGQTWIMSFLYIGTFGSFIGYSFAMPLVIKNTFPGFLADHTFIATYLAGLAFMGALVGSLSRPVGGWLSDKIGGARVTLWCFIGMAVFTVIAIIGVSERSFALFFGSFIVIFFLAGAGNGSTFRMMPAIYAELGRRDAKKKGIDPKENVSDFKRQAAALLGIAGAFGAFGGFLIQVAFRQASLSVSSLVKAADSPADKVTIAAANTDWSIPALWVFFGAYVLFAAVCWFFYIRKSFATKKIPSMSSAKV